MDSQQLKVTPRDFFHYLGILITLYVSAPMLGYLLFSIIDTVYPRVTDYYYAGYYDGSSPISWPVATLIIFAPLYIILSWMLQKDFQTNSGKRDLWIRKWFIYITLFLTSLTIAGDLVSILYYFLDGRLLTAAFLLKVLTVFVIAGLVFMYYLADLRGRLTLSVRKIYVAIALILTIGSIILGFSIIGSPRTQRLMRYDNQQVQNLQNIQWQIVSYWQTKHRLPQTLAETQDPISSYMIPNQPETGKPYEYKIVSNSATNPSFELCADFNLASKNNGALRPQRPEMSAIYPVDGMDTNWQHEAGKTCFTRAIDPDRYPTSEKPVI